MGSCLSVMVGLTDALEPCIDWLPTYIIMELSIAGGGGGSLLGRGSHAPARAGVRDLRGDLRLTAADQRDRARARARSRWSAAVRRRSPRRSRTPARAGAWEPLPRRLPPPPPAMDNSMMMYVGNQSIQGSNASVKPTMTLKQEPMDSPNSCPL